MSPSLELKDEPGRPAPLWPVLPGLREARSARRHVDGGRRSRRVAARTVKAVQVAQSTVPASTRRRHRAKA